MIIAWLTWEVTWLLVMVFVLGGIGVNIYRVHMEVRRSNGWKWLDDIRQEVDRTIDTDQLIDLHSELSKNYKTKLTIKEQSAAAHRLLEKIEAKLQQLCS